MSQQSIDQSDSVESTEKIKTPNKNGTLLAIILVAALPMLLAYIAFFTGWGVPNTTVNAGQILKQPIHVKALFAREKNTLLDTIETHKKWRILIPIFETCDSVCQQNLYTTRQVHVRLSEKGLRLERFAINLGGKKGQDFLTSIKQDYPYLKVESAHHLRWFQWIDSAQSGLSNLNKNFYLLVDQEGFAMMVYTDKQHGNELLKDIKRALKFSIDYQ